MRRLLIALLCLISPALLAHDGMHMDMPKGPELGASAAFDIHGRLWLVGAADGHVRLRHSDDDGGTLSAPIEVNALAERIYAEGENRPKIAFGPHDGIYVSWSQPRAKPWTGFVRFAARWVVANISANRSPCITIAPRAPTASTRWPWMATATATAAS